MNETRSVLVRRAHAIPLWTVGGDQSPRGYCAHMSDNPSKQRPAPRVADLFCGGGGLSEGFSLAGCEVVFGLDNARAAVDTFAANNPGSVAVKTDIREFDLRDIPAHDVLVGGPPCVEFSTSNRGGNGNILGGLLLVQAFLRAVHIHQPRYWVMENVPRITEFLPEDVPLTWIGVDEPGTLHIPTRAVLNAADYGVPQARRRFLMGNFPTPEPTHSRDAHAPSLLDAESATPWRTMGDALRGLPAPHEKSDHRPVADPNYPGFSVPSRDLTGHRVDTALSKTEARRIDKAKTRHPFYGFMPFPDETDRPARTVVATQLGRETVVLPDDRATSGFRRLTPREAATIQTFPVSYQILGGLNAAYRIAGDAVPPLLSYSVAAGVVEGLTGSRPDGPTPAPLPKVLAGPLRPAKRRRQHKPDRRFADMIPGKDVRGCRVELDNRGRDVDDGLVWRAMLFTGEGRTLREAPIDVDLVVKVIEAWGSPRLARAAAEIVYRWRAEVLPTLPDGQVLQRVWIDEDDDRTGPFDVVEAASRLVNDVMPFAEWHGVKVPADAIEIAPQSGIRARLLVSAIVTRWTADALNGQRDPDVDAVAERLGSAEGPAVGGLAHPGHVE
jgi:DNA (cytosine-5)-methyltransferase 1